jgi:hypothetical protein
MIPASLKQEVELLRQQVYELQMQLGAYAAAMPTQRRQTRLGRIAKTVSDSSDTASGFTNGYPDPGTANTFKIRFVDFEYPLQMGLHPSTSTERGDSEAAYDAIAFSLSGQWVPEGSFLMCHRYVSKGDRSQQGEWYFDHPGVSMWRFTLNEDMGATTSNQGNASIRTMAGEDTGFNANIVDDPDPTFSSLASGDKGYAFLQGGTFYVYQAPCPS